MMIDRRALLWNILGSAIRPVRRRRGGTHTVEFSLGIKSNLIDRVGAPHAIVKHCLVNDYVLGGQLLEGIPFLVILGIV